MLFPPKVPSGWGVNVHFTDERPGEVAKIANAFRVVRMDFAWGGIERERGKYDFAAYDRLLGTLKKNGVRPYLILDYGNALYGEGSPRTPGARAAFCRWVAAAMARYRGRGVVWEMWNEPNIGFWQPKPNVEEYIALAKTVGETVRRVAPGETLVGPATSGFDWVFLQRCLDAGLLRYWDAVSVHPYRQTEPETAEADWLRLRAMMDRAGGAGKPMISGEWGYSELYAGQNKERQGECLVRSYLVNLRCGVPISIWYDWKDDGTDPKETEHHFGTVGPDLIPKPAYDAAAHMARELTGFTFVARLYTARREEYWLLFVRGRQVKLVGWNTMVERTTDLPGPGAIRMSRPNGVEYVSAYRVPLSPKPAVFSGAALDPLANWEGLPWVATVRKQAEVDAIRHRYPQAQGGTRGSGGAPSFLSEHAGGLTEVRTVGGIAFTQRMELRSAQPVSFSIYPGRQNGLVVQVGNPFGRDLKGWSVGTDQLSGIPLTPQGQATLPTDARRVFLRTTEKGGLFTNVPRYAAISIVGATATPDGDGKVRAVVSAISTPNGTRLDYDFDPGWRFAEMHPAEERVEGRPSAFGMWVLGDGSGDVLRMRYGDATGQVFQPEFGRIDWKGWRYVSVPLDGSGGRWGGANDGVVHWPIRIGTLALVERPGGRGGKGAVTVTRPVLVYSR